MRWPAIPTTIRLISGFLSLYGLWALIWWADTWYGIGFLIFFTFAVFWVGFAWAAYLEE